MGGWPCMWMDGEGDEGTDGWMALRLAAWEGGQMDAWLVMPGSG